MIIMRPVFFRDFAPDSKLRLLKELSSQAEIVIVISAKDIEKIKSAEIWASPMTQMFSV